ncbi:hypothetical protein BCR44DRAFT_1449106 [Catenaria anguillulae PL171]|uniref:CCHC-type domain-containing protein n=1 Tax=Catenaria anguillulae PL171 TaxID=765915 RepID=A0A1Y2H505_9FUNG|nr:hypothetical protein BCR44DRAFT_1449106 [Catenaria anguillulae PL171]
MFSANGHDLCFAASSTRLCYSCGKSGHYKSACPSNPATKNGVSGPVPVLASATSAGGTGYADAAKKAIEKVDQVDKDLRAQVAELASQVQSLKEQLARFCAQQDVLLAAIKLTQDRVGKEVEDLGARQESTAVSVRGLSADFKALGSRLDQAAAESARPLQLPVAVEDTLKKLSMDMDDVWERLDGMDEKVDAVCRAASRR